MPCSPIGWTTTWPSPTKRLPTPDPWHAFIRYTTSVCAMQAADRGFAAVLSMTFPAAQKLEARRSAAYRGFVDLIADVKGPH
jgi:hypothetical protein